MTSILEQFEQESQQSKKKVTSSSVSELVGQTFYQKQFYEVHYYIAG